MATAHHPAQTGNRWHLWLPSQWALWKESTLSIVYVCAVIALAVAFAVISGLRTPFSGSHAAVFGVMVACAAVCIEGMRRLGQLSGIVHELVLAWTVPVVLLLPPVYAFLLQLPLAAIVQLRVKRGYMYRRAFTAMAKALTGMAAATLFQLGLPPGFALGDALWLAHIGVVLPTAFGCAALCIIGSDSLVGIAIRLSAPDSAKGLELDWESLRIDMVELCVGVLIAVATAIALPLAVLGVPPVLLMQRSLVHEQLRAAARTDSKTGLLNSGTWQVEAETEVTRAQRTDEAVALLLIDIDHFKRVNDQYGHLAGDDVLGGIADLLGGQLRDYDLLGRFGGEEFIVLLPATDAIEASRVAERLRSQAEITAFPIGEGKATVTVTISIGVAHLRTHADELTELIAAADLALYHAKATGRDRVCLPGGGGLDGAGRGSSGPGRGTGGREAHIASDEDGEAEPPTRLGDLAPYPRLARARVPSDDAPDDRSTDGPGNPPSGQERASSDPDGNRFRNPPHREPSGDAEEFRSTQ